MSQKNEKTLRVVKNPSAMVETGEMIRYMLDKTDKQEKELALAQRDIAELNQELADLKATIECERENAKDNKGDWKWAAALIVTVALSLLSFINSIWPR